MILHLYNAVPSRLSFKLSASVPNMPTHFSLKLFNTLPRHIRQSHQLRPRKPLGGLVGLRGVHCWGSGRFYRVLTRVLSGGGGEGVNIMDLRAHDSLQHTTPILHRGKFESTLKVLALSVPVAMTNSVMKDLQRLGAILDRPKIKAVVKIEEKSDHRLILLSDRFSNGAENLPNQVKHLLASSNETVTLTNYTLILQYQHKSANEVLREILPKGMDPPASFETIGHIAHLNLPGYPPDQPGGGGEWDAGGKEEWEGYKRIIGQVILDKNPNLATVVNKVGVISNQYRVFDMEILAGEPRLVTEVSQNGNRFQLDYSQVYWNSRLEHEHARLVEKYFMPGEVVVDLMCGVGPFAIPAAKKGCRVIANDLNKHSVYWLRVNMGLNRVSPKDVIALNMDAKDVFRLLSGSKDLPRIPGFDPIILKPNLHKSPEHLPDPPQVPDDFRAEGGLMFHHIVMNLPRTAIEFLGSFRGRFQGSAWEGKAMPLVHLYTFAQNTESEKDIISRVERHLGGSLEVRQKKNRWRFIRFD
ncbi:hypothetical protein AAMO2058_000387900 [Amorphochlora amoebiformis]